DAAREADPHPPVAVEGQRVAGRGVLADEPRALVEVAEHGPAAAVGMRVELVDAGGGAQPEPSGAILADGVDGARLDAVLGPEALEGQRRVEVGCGSEAHEAAATGAQPGVAAAGD